MARKLDVVKEEVSRAMEQYDTDHSGLIYHFLLCNFHVFRAGNRDKPGNLTPV